VGWNSDISGAFEEWWSWQARSLLSFCWGRCRSFAGAELRLERWSRVVEVLVLVIGLVDMAWRMW
jgi:hypothetical protein